MPEITKTFDPFGDALARGFLFGESAAESGSRGLKLPLDVAPHFLNGYLDHGALAYKPLHHGHEEHPKGVGMAPHSSPFTDPDFFGGANPFLSHEKEMKMHQQQTESSGFSTPFSLHQNFSAQALEVSEIDECSSWMSDVLVDISAIHQEFSAVPAEPDSDFDLISSVPANFQRSIGLPTSQSDFRVPNISVVEGSDVTSSTTSAPSAPLPPAPPATPTPFVLPAPSVAPPSSVAPGSPTTPSTSRSLALANKARPAAEEVVSGLPTPPSLKPRRLRTPKTCEKKKIVKGEQWEHVRRERKRRDDMTFKIATLESLLPVPDLMGNPKRDRATIVHDSVHHVRSLQNEVEQLKKKLAELDQRRRSESILNRAIAREHANSKIWEAGTDGKGGKFVEYHIEIEGNLEDGARLEKCRCRPDYLSRAMRVFEDLNLDVLRCTMTRMCLYTMCIVVAKPRVSSSVAVSSSAVVEALRSSITLV